MKSYSILLVIALICFSCQNTDNKEEQEQSKDQTSVITPEFLELGVMCGTVQFEDGCSPQIDSLISFGLALVHHMTYDDAEYNFDKVIEQDPDCFWGHWGKALTYIHPLWPDEPNNDRLEKGLALVNKALSLAQKEKENYYGQALAAYYKDGFMRSEKERLVTYEEGWKRASERYPDDLEARLFHGLIRLGTVSPSDKSYKVQSEVGAMAEKTLETIPDHPGGFHYAIHAYDFPPLAKDAIRVAKNYASIAPDIPHALHMPTHIFTRLGYWDESIEGNTKSAAAAIRMPVNGATSLHYVHALDYLVYAHIQKSESHLAEKIFNDVNAMSAPFQKHAAVAYALAAMPARLALENQDWKGASKLELPYAESFQWESFPQFLAINEFAKGVGAARNGDLDGARKAHSELDSLHRSMGDSYAKAYWAKQIEIQKIAVEAWIAYMDGDHDKGMVIMNKAAEMEDSTTKSPITPGELLPVREMLGDLYLDQGKAELALDNYKKSLERNPNRFNTILGAARAAESLNNKEEAKTYYEALLKLGLKTDPNRVQIKYAEDFVKA